MRASPLQQVYDRFGGDERSPEARQAAKQALVKSVQAFVKKGDLLEDEFSDKGIDRVSNAKLLKILDLAEAVQSEFGSRAALVDKVLEIEGRAKDAGYREHLDGKSLSALFSRYEVSLKRSRKS